MLNYPLQFKPLLKEKVWGGKKLHEILGKQARNELIGESWEISGLEESASIVANGTLKGKSLPELLETYKEKLVGKENFKKFGLQFPLLIKFIDAETPLSVQVHPDDTVAKKRHNSYGKTEMWYVLQADEGAELNIGFKKDIGKEEFLHSLNTKKLPEILNFEKITAGDCFLINAGKIHAIGGGVLLAEIQQPSDITYRIYDWDRKTTGKDKRELHTELAMDVINFNAEKDFKLDYKPLQNQSAEIIKGAFFSTNFLWVKGEMKKDYTNLDSFVILICLEGKVEVALPNFSRTIYKGETILLPALLQGIHLKSKESRLLEVFLQA